MDLDQLQSVRDRERQTDRLQQLRDSFYEEAAEFVHELRAEREEAAAAADDPFDAPRVTRLTDRIRTAEQTLEAIYEKRVGKVVKAATFAAADLPAEAEGMTREETDLFETLVAEIEDNRATVLGRLGDDEVDADLFGDEADGAVDGDAPPDGEPDDGRDGDTADALGAADVMGEDPATGEPEQSTPDPPEPPEDPPSATGDDSPTARDAGESDGPGQGHAGDGDANGTDADGDPDATRMRDDAPDADVDRELVRITDDVGPILGVDEREYDLSADDVVTLPAENARPLVERGVAERLE